MMRPFLKSDYGQYSQWFIKRAMNPPPLAYLPSTGFIVDGVAASFLIKTDTKVAIIEYTATNPMAESKDRNDAIDEIFSELVMIAKKAGYKFIYGNTEMKDIEERAEKYGFKSIGKFHAFIKEI